MSDPVRIHQTNTQALRVAAFLIVVVPLLVPLNLLAWRIALGWTL